MTKTACIFGGTGFIGEQIVGDLCKAGYRVKIATRAPASTYEIKTAGDVGQIVGMLCDYSDTHIARVIDGCDLVINLVGVLYEKKKHDFTRLHTDLPATIARICGEKNIARFIHLSALGVDKSESRYARSKKLGEEAVLRHFPSATILRPSIVFGANDQLFNRFARMAAVMPFLPLIGGKTKFQPVYVGDVAGAVLSAAQRDETKGQIYELGGPDVLTFKELYQKQFAVTRRPRCLIPVPFSMAKIMGAVLGILPCRLLTKDQVESLKTDNIVQAAMPGLAELGIIPTSLDAILPTYLQQYRPGGRFADKRVA